VKSIFDPESGNKSEKIFHCSPDSNPADGRSGSTVVITAEAAPLTAENIKIIHNFTATGRK
jgi:hypothetical protein